jgi:hypothetical protein
MNRKEYNDRWNAPLVNPPITLGEYEKARNQSEAVDSSDWDGKCKCKNPIPGVSRFGQTSVNASYCINCLGDLS